MKSATNSEIMKENNKKLILRLIMKGEYSRADISKVTGLTKAAVSIITEDLLQNNIITESDSDYIGVGRRPKILSINKDCYYTAGVNITRSSYEVGIHNFFGEVAISEKRAILDSPYEVMDDIYNVLMYQLKKMNLSPDELLGIGITTPGPVDVKKLLVMTPPNFESWHNISFDYLKNKFNDNVNIRLENISNACAIYEKYYDNNIKSDNYIVVLIADDGIGAGIVLDGSLYRGATGFAGEFGHITVDFNGKLCTCGNRGCLECYASMSEILKGTSYNSWKAVINSNDESIIEKESKYLASALTSVINLLATDTVVLTGDIGYKSAKICGMIEEKLSRGLIAKNNISVISSPLKNAVAIAGSSVINYFLS